MLVNAQQGFTSPKNYLREVSSGNREQLTEEQPGNFNAGDCIMESWLSHKEWENVRMDRVERYSARHADAIGELQQSQARGNAMLESWWLWCRQREQREMRGSRRPHHQHPSCRLRLRFHLLDLHAQRRHLLIMHCRRGRPPKVKDYGSGWCLGSNSTTTRAALGGCRKRKD